ncbi:MAG TPA: GTPase ObgE [Rhabdochlamydiaceae bacterium]|jgi:GTP-binding protein
MFVDSVKVTLRAGKGGNGVVAWRREKFIPKGGPAGGDGGKGGAIHLKMDTHLVSLEELRNRRLICAENGQSGAGALKKGRNGKDLVIKIPPGTLVKDALTGEVIFDFTQENQEWTICRGGKGGKGNARFKSPTNQAPIEHTLGEEGEYKDIELELKLIADVGLIGMPNAGKSTLLSQLARVPVKIGAYPFTTLYPNLSYVQFEDLSRVFIADIPGIIQDAHLDKGLGLSFLRHIERSSVLIFLIDISGIEGRDPFEDFCLLQNELKAYRPDLLKKPFLTVLNKIDCEEEASVHSTAFQKRYPYPQETLYAISALSGDGLAPFVEAMRALAQAKATHSDH